MRRQRLRPRAVRAHRVARRPSHSSRSRQQARAALTVVVVAAVRAGAAEPRVVVAVAHHPQLSVAICLIIYYPLPRLYMSYARSRARRVELRLAPPLQLTRRLLAVAAVVEEDYCRREAHGARL